MTTADYWPDILEKLDDNEAENARRTTWYNERGQDYPNEKARRKDWERVQKRRRDAKRQIYCLSSSGRLS